MRLTFTAAIFFLLSVPGIVKAADRFIPAGMPIGCWMQEKDLSLKRAQVGEPVLCYLSPGKCALDIAFVLIDGTQSPGHFKLNQ